MIQPETASSSAAARLLGAIYTGGIIIAEGLTVTVDARLGLVAYTLLMVALVYTISLNWQNAANRVLVALLFVPLVRLLTLALPLSYFSTVNQFGVLGFVLLIACLMAVTRLNLSWGAVGLIPRRPLLQLIIAATGVAAKRESVSARANPDHAILAEGRFREAVSAITEGRLADIVFDPVGGDVFDESTRCVAFGGKLVVVGFTSGRIAEIATNIPLIKGFSVVGLRAGEYARRFPERGAAINAAVRELAESGRISPAIDRTLPLADWREGFEAMARRDLVGKVVFEP